MPRTATQFERLRVERRGEILAAARPIFAAQGLPAAKIADVARAAAMSYGLVYHYFPTKEALYARLVEEALAGTLALTTQALAREGSSWDNLRWLCERILGGMRANPREALLVFQAATSPATPDETRSVLKSYGEQILATVAELIRRGQAVGQVAGGDPRELATVFLATIQGLALNTLEEHVAGRPWPRAATVLRLLVP